VNDMLARPIAAPLATENAEEAVRQTVARKGIRRFLRRMACTYSSKCRSGDHLRIIQTTMVANAAPMTGVKIRRAGGNVAATMGNTSVCRTMTH
jgi:acyl-CoA thioesterase FadM